HCCLYGTPRNEVRNCQFIGEMSRSGITVYGKSSTATNRTVLRNNLIVATGIPLDVKVTPAADVDLQLIRNTLVGYGTVVYMPGCGRPDAHTLDPVAAAPKSLRIEATGNIFDARFDVFNILTSKKYGERSAKLLQERGHWKGALNLFAGDACLGTPSPEG